VQLGAGKVFALMAKLHLMLFGTDIVLTSFFQMGSIAIHSPAAGTRQLLFLQAMSQQGWQQSGIILYFVTGAISTIDSAGRHESQFILDGHRHTSLNILPLFSLKKIQSRPKNGNEPCSHSNSRL